MRPAFSLVHEPWIPCLLPDGEERAYGLLEALVEAPGAAELLDPSPLITISLHRLLLAVLGRALSPVSEQRWVEWWQAGRWPVRALAEYLGAWAARFDLFDRHWPFYQQAGLPPKLLAPVSRLSQELASGTRATLFDHTLDASADAVTAAHAARLVVAYHSFCSSGCCGDETGLSSVRAGSLAHAAVFLAVGRSLFETLMLNLVPEPNAQSGALNDLPAWESDEPVAHATRQPQGHLDHLTWQSRRLCLVPEAGPDGWQVSRVAVSGGWEAPRDHVPDDPMLAYRQARRGGADGPTWLPLSCPEPGGWWQARSALLTRTKPGLRPPRSLMWVGELVACGVLDPHYRCTVAVFGLRGEKARIDDWAHHRQPLPVRYLEDGDLASDLERCLELAEQTGSALSRALAPTGAPHGAPAPGHTTVAGDYWSRLEAEFSRLLQALPGDLQHRDAVLLWWAETCARAAWSTFQGACRHRPLEPWALRPLAQARRVLVRGLYGRALGAYRAGEQL
jgi:CRISPR system Cascade subunit CasA